MARLVFIPKAGTASYNKAKPFKPLCLTAFLLKLQERLIERHNKEEALVAMPLHNSEHTNKIENVISLMKLIVGTFLDIAEYLTIPLMTLFRERWRGTVSFLL